MSAKHTPGPWVIEENPYVSPAMQVAAFEESGNRHLQILVHSHNREADARLIAVAPELLEALEGLLTVQSKSDERICCDGLHCGCRGAAVHEQAEHYAREAIAKARGEQS